MLRFRVEPIDLPRGWSGSALVGVEDGRQGSGLIKTLPTKSEWPSILKPVLADVSVLPGYEVLKFSSSGEVFRVRLGSGDHEIDVICKRHRLAGLRRRLAALLGLRPLRLEFERGAALLRAGIDTALPLALIRRTSGRPEEWQLHEFVADGVDLDHFLLSLLPRLDARRSRAAKTAILESLVTLFGRMYEHGLHHRDLKASNIMLVDWEGRADSVRVCLVDLEGLKRRRWRRGNWHWKPVVRLAASVLSYHAITRSDYCRFLQAYVTRTGQTKSAWKLHYRLVAGMAAGYVRRSFRRKKERIDGYESLA